MPVDLSMVRSAKSKSRSKISKTLRDNLYMIKCLDEAKEDTRRGAMRCCSRQMCDSMSEIAANLLKGNIPLTDHQFSILKRYAKDIEALSKKKTRVSKRREILQKGGFLRALLGPVMRFLMPVVKPVVQSLIPEIVGSMLGPPARDH